MKSLQDGLQISEVIIILCIQEVERDFRVVKKAYIKGENSIGKTSKEGKAMDPQGVIGPHRSKRGR